MNRLNRYISDGRTFWDWLVDPDGSVELSEQVVEQNQTNIDGQVRMLEQAAQNLDRAGQSAAAQQQIIDQANAATQSANANAMRTQAEAAADLINNNAAVSAMDALQNTLGTQAQTQAATQADAIAASQAIQLAALEMVQAERTTAHIATFGIIGTVLIVAVLIVFVVYMVKTNGNSQPAPAPTTDQWRALTMQPQAPMIIDTYRVNQLKMLAQQEGLILRRVGDYLQFIDPESGGSLKETPMPQITDSISR